MLTKKKKKKKKKKIPFEYGPANYKCVQKKIHNLTLTTDCIRGA